MCLDMQPSALPLRGLLPALVAVPLLLAIAIAGGCGGSGLPGDVGPADLDRLAPGAAANAEDAGRCRLTGRIVSTEYRKHGGGIERAIVTAWKLPELESAGEVNSEGEDFTLHLPPDRYRLVYSAVGTRGATFDVDSREITIGADETRVDLGLIDLPISKSTALYGQPAPELDGIIAWKDTPPIVLKELRGKVVVLDFFAYTCSICIAHQPDLVRLHEKYGERGLVVLAVHDDSVATLEQMNEKLEAPLRHAFRDIPPRFPIALDGAGDESVFEAYGIYAVPALILIDPHGRIVRRYHHAGKPELEADIRKLLNVRD